MKNTVTATNENGCKVRISLPEAIWKGSDEVGTGVTRQAIYVSPRARRCVVETYSIWQKPGSGGEHVGTQYTLIEDQDVLAGLAEEYPEVGEALEKAGLIEVEAL